MRIVRAASIVVVGWLLSAAAAQSAAVIEYGMSFYNPAGPSTKVSWAKVVTLLNQYLDEAQQINVFTDMCYDGNLIGEAQAAASGLKMNAVIGTSTNATTKSVDGFSGTKDQNPPGRLKSLDGNYYFSTKAYLAKTLSGGTTTVKLLHAAAAAAVAADPGLSQTPQYYTSKDANDGLKVDEGTASSHALLFAGNLGGLYIFPPRSLFQAIRGVDFTSEAFYFADYVAQQLPEGGALSGPGTYANFELALKGLEAQVDGNKDRETVSLFLVGHGSREVKNVNPKSEAQPGQTRQGAEARASDPATLDFALTLDSTFWQDLKEEVVLDDPNLVRGDPASFFLTVSEYSLTGSLSAYIGGVGGPFLQIGSFGLGDFETQTGSSAAILDVSLSDDLIRNLVAAYDGVSDLIIRFAMSGDDWFRLALRDDLLFDPTYFPTTYGVGLATVVSEIRGVPEPGSTLLLMVMGLTMVVLIAGRQAHRG